MGPRRGDGCCKRRVDHRCAGRAALPGGRTAFALPREPARRRLDSGPRPPPGGRGGRPVARRGRAIVRGSSRLPNCRGDRSERCHLSRVPAATTAPRRGTAGPEPSVGARRRDGADPGRARCARSFRNAAARRAPHGRDRWPATTACARTSSRWRTPCGRGCRPCSGSPTHRSSDEGGDPIGDQQEADDQERKEHHPPLMGFTTPGRRRARKRPARQGSRTQAPAPRRAPWQ